MRVAKITTNKTLEVMHMSNDNAVNQYILVWSYMEFYVTFIYLFTYLLLNHFILTQGYVLLTLEREREKEKH